MTEYTRKPWRAEQNLRYSGLCDVYDKDGNILAEARVPEVARLIGAAPGLLAVCQYICFQAAPDKLRADVKNDDMMCVYLSAGKLRELAAAIAKAMGG